MQKYAASSKELIMKDKKGYTVYVSGCDDSTVFTIALTDEEAAGMKRVVQKCNETSTYGCMPTMSIELEDES
jgi:acid stress-induced BolA-like protein IbaG/YrbA